MTERRYESRFMCADLVGVEWSVTESTEDLQPDKAGALKVLEGVLEDISSLGACVQVDEEIPSGATLTIHARSMPEASLSGTVTYCVYRDYGYFVGVRFANDTRWSSVAYLPQHLTSLDSLRDSAQSAPEADPDQRG